MSLSCLGIQLLDSLILEAMTDEGGPGEGSRYWLCRREWLGIFYIEEVSTHNDRHAPSAKNELKVLGIQKIPSTQPYPFH